MSAVMFGCEIGRTYGTYWENETYVIVAKLSLSLSPQIRDEYSEICGRDEKTRNFLTKTSEFRQLDGRSWDRKYVLRRSWLSYVSGRKSLPFVTWRCWVVSHQLDDAASLSWQSSSC
jgi:hypothetical protein